MKQEGAFESGGPSAAEGPTDGEPEDEPEDKAIIYGGAKVGDYIQWEASGQFQFSKPLRVRSVSDDNNWVAVEGSKTGIPMSQVIVEAAPQPAEITPPPVFEFDAPEPKTSDKENDIKITLDGSKLQIVGHNIDIAGVALLRKQLEKYEEILKLITPEVD